MNSLTTRRSRARPDIHAGRRKRFPPRAVPCQGGRGAEMSRRAEGELQRQTLHLGSRRHAGPLRTRHGLADCGQPAPASSGRARGRRRLHPWMAGVRRSDVRVLTPCAGACSGDAAYLRAAGSPEGGHGPLPRKGTLAFAARRRNSGGGTRTAALSVSPLFFPPFRAGYGVRSCLPRSPPMPRLCAVLCRNAAPDEGPRMRGSVAGALFHDPSGPGGGPGRGTERFIPFIPRRNAGVLRRNRFRRRQDDSASRDRAPRPAWRC